MADDKTREQAVDALRKAARAFEKASGEQGEGQAGGESFAQALQPFVPGARGIGDRPEGVEHKAEKADPALLGVTRNLRFAQALVNEEQELEPGVRSVLEGKLGRSLANVKIYAGRYADLAARALGAKAFAIGQRIFFRADSFHPTTSEGLGILAHEAMHTVQDQGGSVSEKEEQAREFQSRASQLAESAGEMGYGGAGFLDDMELAIEHTVGKAVDTIDTSSLAKPGGTGRSPDEDMSPANVSKAPDEDFLMHVLRKALFEKIRDEIEMEYTIHGVDTRP